jgi:NAD(P)-dependent dehydrogenase (short-subunit alcohol dehydrogenase family)
MSKSPLRNKVALILGADSLVGRAASLQLSREGARVLIVAGNAQRLALLTDLLLAKGGAPTAIPLTPDMADLREALREGTNHVHYLLNCLTGLEPAADDPTGAARESIAHGAAVHRILAAQKTLREVLLWPDDCLAEPPAPPPGRWRCLVSMAKLQRHPEGAPTDEADALRAAAVADAIIQLLQCPPAAFPQTVRLAATPRGDNDRG